MRTHKTPKGIDIIEFSKPEESSGPILEEVLSGLQSRDSVASKALKYLPTLLLYDDHGLELYDKITDLKEYYLFPAELELLNAHADDIARSMFEGVEEEHSDNHEDAPSLHEEGKSIPSRLDGKWGDYESGSHNWGVNGQLHNEAPSQIVELGAGSLKKTGVLLRALATHSSNSHKSLTYTAVDLEYDQLVSTLDSLLSMETSSVTNAEESNDKVLIKGARASYEEFLPQLSPKSVHGTFQQTSRKTLLWLGSSLGNFTREEAAEMLKRYVNEGLQPGDRFLIGIDSTMDGPKIELAYGDPTQVTEGFILNGLDHLARLFSQTHWKSNLDGSKFSYVHRFNAEDGCHEAYVQANCSMYITPPSGSTVIIDKHEMILIERSFKYTSNDIVKLLDRAGLRLVKDWKHAQHKYGLYLVEKPAFYFSSTQVDIEKGLNPFGLPSLEEWKRLWAAYDTVTLDMIPPSMLHTKPIDLRHICLFYIGHIPTFCQIHLSRALNEPYTHPAEYTQIFERGIDPNMDDPTQCHDHSIVPEKEEDWPKLFEILAYRDRVRQRMGNLYETGRLDKINGDNRRLARAVAMVYEHEAFHLETLLYMLLQKSEAIKAPPHFSAPDWETLAVKWDTQVAREGKMRSQPLSFNKTTLTYGINDKDSEDFEKPLTANHVFGWDNENGIRSIEVPEFKISPTPISNLEYLDFLKANDFTEELVPASWFKAGSNYGIRVVYGPGFVNFNIGQHWPVLASAKQLAAFATSKGGRLPTEAEVRIYQKRFPADMPGSNVGFRNWHPIPASIGESDRGDIVGSHNGGAWEWTTTNFDTYEGFSSSLLYPGYSSDFFDNTHSVILGGSWATIPRLAGRPSCRNWYQTGYQYTFSTARVAWDA